jgi:hypothetical protein
MGARAIEQAEQAAYVIQGREVRLPVEVRDATAGVASYLVPAGSAQRLIDHTGLRIARVLPGKAICTIGTMEYRDGDLGRYHEVSVSFFVRERGERAVPLVGNLLGLVRGSLGAYIHQLPVDGAFTCEAGQTIWGYPKFMAEISISRAGDIETSTLRADGEHVLTQTVRMGGSRSFSGRAQVSYAHRGGTLYRTPSVMHGESMGARLGGATLELGTHRIAQELRSLGLPKGALFSTHIGRMSATFDGAQRR